MSKYSFILFMDSIGKDCQNIIYDYKHKAEYRKVMKELAIQFWIINRFKVNTSFEDFKSLYGDDIIYISCRKFLIDGKALNMMEYIEHIGEENFYKKISTFEQLYKETTYVDYSIPCGIPPLIYLHTKFADDFRISLAFDEME